MLKIKMFEEPKVITLKEIINDMRKKDCYYIERFEYGDYDNWVTAIIINLKIPMRYIQQATEGPNINKWNVCKESTWTSLSNITKDKIKPGKEIELSDALKENIYSKKEVSYDFGRYFDHIEDIYDTQVEVIGVVETRVYKEGV